MNINWEIYHTKHLFAAFTTALLWNHWGANSFAIRPLAAFNLFLTCGKFTFQYHFPKIIRTDPTFDFQFKPWTCWIAYSASTLLSAKTYLEIYRISTILKIQGSNWKFSDIWRFCIIYLYCWICSWGRKHC